MSLEAPSALPRMPIDMLEPGRPANGRPTLNCRSQLTAFHWRNWCISGPETGDPGTIRGDFGTFEIPPGKCYARARSQICFSDPKFRYRPRELPLANPMGEFDSGQSNDRTAERLEASHRSASTFDRSVILRGHRGKYLDSALRKNVCAAATLRSGRSRKSTVLPCLSTR